MPTLTLIIELTVGPKHFRQIFHSFHEKSMKFWLHFKKKNTDFPYSHRNPLVIRCFYRNAFMRKFLRISGRDVNNYMGNRTAVSVEVSRVSTKGTTIGLESAGTARKRLRVPINIGRHCKSMVEMPSAQ